MKKLTLALSLLLIVCFALLVWLCFFQFPSNDDLVGTYLKGKYGMGGSIQWYLSHKNGRFSTIPAFLWISSSRAMLAQYGYLLLFFLMITYCSVFIFIKVLGRQLFEPRLTNTRIALIAAMALMIFLVMVPEVSSFIYWMATSVTYLFPFAVFLLLITAYAYLLKQGQQHKWGWAVIICLLTCFLIGSNEIMLFYSCALPFFIAGVFVVSRKPLPAQLYLIMAVAVGVALAILLVPGNNARAHTFARKQSLAASIAGSSFWTWETLEIIFSNPFFYISCFGALVASMYLKPSVMATFSAKRSNWLMEAGVIIAMIFVFDFLLRQIGGHMLPLRATNIIICLSLLGFWWVLLMNAARLQELIRLLLVHQRFVQRVFVVAFLIALVGSSFFLQLGRNLVAAPIHLAVMHQRVEWMEQEKAKGKKLVEIPPYQATVAEILQKRFKGKNLFMLERFPCPPTFTYFKDEPHSSWYAYFYAEFYGIDTIAGADGKFARWGLTNRN